MTEQKLTLDELLEGAKQVERWEQVMMDRNLIVSHYEGTANGVTYHVQRGGWIQKGVITAYFGSAYLGMREDHKITKFFDEIKENYNQKEKDKEKRDYEEGLKRVRESGEGTR